MVVELAEESVELRFFFGGHFDTDEHAAVVSAMVTVMEKADIPVVTQAVQKFHEGPGPIRKLEAIQELILYLVGTPTNEMANVQFRHLIIAEVHRSEAIFVQTLDQHGRLLAIPHRDRDKYVGFLWVGVPVVEFSNAFCPEHGTEFLEAARLLGNCYGHHCFAMLPQFGAFGNMTQAVEIHVGTRSDCNEILCVNLLSLGICLCSSDG